VTVSFDVPSAGILVPGRVSFVSEGQINVQIPWELAGTGSAIMKVTLSNSASRNVRSDNSRLTTFRTQTITLPIAPYSPAFFEYQESPLGRLLAAALDEQYRVISSSNPARSGKVIQFYMNGLGEVTGDARPVSGELSPSSPLAMTKSNPAVTIGGLPARVEFSGLAPLTVGLYQVNVVVPDGLDPGVRTVELSIGGMRARSAIAIE
jgi:uncharacterized protein (TIGR03437 family)